MTSCSGDSQTWDHEPQDDFVRELGYMGKRMTQVAGDVASMAGSSPVLSMPDVENEQHDSGADGERNRTTEQVKLLPSWVQVTVLHVWDLAGQMRCPRKRTTRSICEDIRARAKEATGDAPGPTAAVICQVARRYFKTLRAIQKSIAPHAFVAVDVPQARRPDLADLVGSDTEDEEVVSWLRSTLERNGAVLKRAALIEPVPEEQAHATPSAESPRGERAESSETLRGKRSRLLGGRTLHSMPSLQSVRPQPPPRQRPSHRAIAVSGTAHFEIAEVGIDIADPTTRVILLRHDTDQLSKAVDLRMTSLRHLFELLLDETRQIGHLIGCHNELKSQLDRDCDLVRKFVVPARKNVLRLLQVCCVLAVTDPRLLC